MTPRDGSLCGPLPNLQKVLLWVLLLGILGSGLAWARPAPIEGPSPPPPPTAPASEQAGPVRFLYPAGPILKHEKPFPLIIELSNPGNQPRTFRTVLGNDKPPTPELASVTLEPGETRRFPVFFPRLESSGVKLLTVDETWSPDEAQGAPRDTITALLAPPSERFDYLRTLKLEVDPTVAAPTVAEGETPPPPALVPLASLSTLNPEILPEGWPMLSCLNTIIAYNLPSLRLSTRQQNALLSWVVQGGRLVLVSDGNPEEFRNTPFEPHLPLQARGVRSRAGLLQLVGEVRPQADVLMNFEGAPLLLRQRLVRGEVLLVTAPLTERGPLTLPQAEELWRWATGTGSADLVQPTPANPYAYGRSFSQLPDNCLNDIPELPRASAGWVVLFLLCYAIIVGPVNLVVLRRKDRMLWAFVTIPVIAVLFAGGAYLASRASRASTPVLREIGLLVAQSGRDRAWGISEGLFYSPASQTYPLDNSPESLCQQAGYSRGMSSADPFGPLTLLPDGGLRASLRLGVWDLLRLNFESVVKLPQPFEGRWKDGVLQVHLPWPTQGQEAMVYSTTQGGSPLFALRGGSQKETLTLSDPGNFTHLDSLGRTGDPKNHPGRQELTSALNNQASQLLRDDRTYLLFWTDQVQTPVRLPSSSLHRGEFLVIMELTS